jgi:GNAT superfamily N-acetyltransferase
MVLVDRLQTYLRKMARRQYQAVEVPPFTVFVHRSNDLIFFNYAIPECAAGPEALPALARVRAAFAEHRRQPRFEYIEEFAPDLAPALQAAGFREDARLQLMVCTPQTFRPAPDVPGLSVTEIQLGATTTDARDYLWASRQGFDPTNISVPTEEEAEAYLRDARGAFLGRLDGAPAGVSAFMPPIDGVTEIAGIATREPFRRRGIASLLTAHAVCAAFAEGVEVACLSAADERAGRVYERVGFQPCATMLFYIAPKTPADQA